MLWVKAFHIIFMVTWFAGLFYLPRLYVYHAQCQDELSNQRFKIMERKLYYGIMMPGGILTTLFGLGLLGYGVDLHQGWLHAKFALVGLLWVFHLYCGRINKVFKADRNTRQPTFYRWYNEIPTILLIGIVILVVVKPF